MADLSSWHGDWHQRIADRVRGAGCGDLEEFVALYPGRPLVDLARQLGEHDVNAMQLETLLRESANQSGRIEFFMRDLLARELNATLPLGWGLAPPGGDAELDAIRGLASWEAMLPTEARDRARLVGDRLFAAQPPAGWRPAGADDPILLELFAATGGDDAASR